MSGEVNFHYSGYDHRPYDYSTKPREQLDDSFIKSRFAHSLTNIYPRNYSPEEKEKLYTLDFAEHALAKGDISAPKDRTVLWSGGHIPNHPLGYGLGRIIAERWLVEKNKEIELSKGSDCTVKDLYHTVAMTEAGLPVLNPMWDDKTVPNETKWAVTPTYIMGFAKTAKGEVSLNVDDTDKDSFFRQNEVALVMNNEDITSVRIVRVNFANDKLEEVLYPDRFAWYEAQKDQWVGSIITRFESATKEPRDEVLYTRMTKALLDEIIESYKNYSEENPLLEKAPERAKAKNKETEYSNLLRFAPIINSHPELLKHEKLQQEGLSEKLEEFFLKTRVVSEKEILGDKRIVDANPNPKRLVFLQGATELIQDSKSQGNGPQAKDILKQILPFSKTKPYGYEFVVPKFISGLSERDLIYALLDKEKTPEFCRLLTDNIFPVDKILAADNKLEFAKEMASNTTLFGYSYGTYLGRKVSECLQENLVKVGFSESEVDEVVSHLKVINIATIMDCVSDNTLHTEISFLHSGDTMASLFMYKDEVEKVKDDSEPFKAMIKRSLKPENKVENPNCNKHDSSTELSVSRNGNLITVISSEEPEANIGYYSLHANAGKEASILDADSALIAGHTYNPNKHGIRGHIFGNEHIPELGAITLAQNSFSDILRPILRAALIGSKELNADVIQSEFLNQEQLDFCKKANSTAGHLQKELEKEFTTRTRT